MILTDSFKLDLLVTFVTSIVILVTKHLWDLRYWKRKGVPGPEPSILMGTMQDLFKGKKSMADMTRDQYLEQKSKGHRYYGCYFGGNPNFIPIDLDLLKSILQTDFQHFHSHGMYHNEDADPLSANLFNLDGTKWKDVRAKLTPTFTSGKLKMMHHILTSNAHIFKEVLNDSAEKEPLDIKMFFNRFTTDNISSCAFGLDVNSLENPDAEFIKIGSKIFENSLINLARNLPPVLVPHWFLKAINYSVTSKMVGEFIYGTVTATIKYREENKINRNDFMNLMVEMKNSNDPKQKLTINEIASQAFIFFAAGFETSATTSTFTTYELAVNQKIQEKVREEINRVLKKHNNELTYEAVNEMEYLHQVIQEVLRKHPPVDSLIRKCTENFKLPGETLEIEKGTLIGIAVNGLHHDPEYFPNPENFDPDRFSEENKKKIPQFAWLPFGECPRICIGARFGMHQSKIGIITLLRSFRITLSKKTKTPIVYSKSALVTTVDGGIWLDLEKLDP